MWIPYEIMELFHEDKAMNMLTEAQWAICLDYRRKGCHSSKEAERAYPSNLFYTHRSRDEGQTKYKIQKYIDSNLVDTTLWSSSFLEDCCFRIPMADWRRMRVHLALSEEELPLWERFKNDEDFNSHSVKSFSFNLSNWLQAKDLAYLEEVTRPGFAETDPDREEDVTYYNIDELNEHAINFREVWQAWRPTGFKHWKLLPRAVLELGKGGISSIHTHTIVSRSDEQFTLLSGEDTFHTMSYVDVSQKFCLFCDSTLLACQVPKPVTYTREHRCEWIVSESEANAVKKRSIKNYGTNPTNRIFDDISPVEELRCYSQAFENKRDDLLDTLTYIPKGELNMNAQQARHTATRLVTIHLFDDDESIQHAEDRLVATFKNLVTDVNNDLTIQELILNQDVAKHLKKHNEKRASLVNQTVLMNTGQEVKLQPVRLHQLRWDVVN